MTEIKRRHFLRAKEGENLLRKFSEILGIDTKFFFEGKTNIEIVDLVNAKIYLVNSEPNIAERKGVLFPTLFFNRLIAFLPKIVVDMGAISHICSGADIMSPGIVEVRGEFQENRFGVILDKKNEKAIAVGLSLLSSDLIRNTRKGKALKNLHYISDIIWSTLRSFARNETVKT